MRKIAITGNIGSGKTTVCKILKNIGYKVFECDLEVKKLYKTIKLKNKVRKMLGHKISNLFFRNGRINIRCEALIHDIWKQSKREEILVKSPVKDEIAPSTNYHQSLDMAIVMFDIFLVYT